MEKIPTLSQQHQFLELLKNDEISKILFSGRFGTGKTTFLYDCFNQEESFIPIFLLPVNYSVASNEDIFEYIKYDILIQFLQWTNISEYLSDISNTVVAQVLLMTDPKTFIINVLKAYSKTSNITDKIQELVDGTKILKRELDKYKESQQIDDFFNDFIDKKGTLFESNLITDIIKSIIIRWKEANEDKKLCLVIDDTERIDPEHIFRILNVFAAHNDIEDHSKNKFGFDKIITVCDAQNLQSIFHARYGLNTDFYGYISKFHSRSIFYFDFQKEIINQIDTIFKNYKVGTFDFINSYNFFYQDRLKYILSELIKNHMVTIRMIKKTFNANLDLSFIEEQPFYYDAVTYNKEAEYIIWLYKILIKLFDGKSNLYEALNKMVTLHPFSYEIEDSRRVLTSPLSLVVSDIIYLLDRKKIMGMYNKWQSGSIKSDDDVLFYTLPNNIDITYDPTKGFLNGIQIQTDLKSIPIPLWKMLIIAFQRVELILEYKTI